MNISQIRAMGPWLAEGKYVWLSLSTNVVALIAALYPIATESQIRITGLVLQLLGIGTVIWGISETRALFGRPSIASKTKSWFQRLPLLNRNVSIGVVSAPTLLIVGKARAFNTCEPEPTSTVDTRLAALEKNISLIHGRITETQKELDHGLHNVEGALKAESEIRRSEDAAIQQKLEVTGTGGVHISALGAAWLFVGVVLSTAAPEIAAWAK